jgi:exodeoxyribonuclease VII large subunit
VARGGGSLEDLWAFNEEMVAESIYLSNIPIISAVGHETDFSLSDFVADIRAPTPSAAAMMVVGEKIQMQQTLSHFHQKMTANLLNQIKTARDFLKHVKKHPFLASPIPLLSKKMQILDDLLEDFDLLQNHFIEKKLQFVDSLKKQLFSLNPTLKLQTTQQKTQNYSSQITQALLSKISFLQGKFKKETYFSLTEQAIKKTAQAHEKKLKNIASHLQSIDPKNLLKRGYSILFSKKKNSIILSTKQVETHDVVNVLVSDGNLQAEIKEIL